MAAGRFVHAPKALGFRGITALGSNVPASRSRRAQDARTPRPIGTPLVETP